MCKSSPVLFFKKGFSPLVLIMIIQDIQVPQMIFASLCQDMKCVSDAAEPAGMAIVGVRAHSSPR